jgi:hypothetical protein
MLMVCWFIVHLQQQSLSCNPDTCASTFAWSFCMVVPSVLLSEMKHMVVLSLLNNIKVYVVTHVKVNYRPIVALSDDVVSVVRKSFQEYVSCLC